MYADRVRHCVEFFLSYTLIIVLTLEMRWDRQTGGQTSDHCFTLPTVDAATVKIATSH